jgi:regulator of protease activity HflC (stomatin/prohibitin superfamily)
MSYATILLVVLVAAVALLAWRANVQSVTVYEFQRGLKYVRGRFRGVLEPGRYTVLRSTTTVRLVDVRPTIVAVAGQEVLSADGVALKVSLAARYRVADPALAVNGVENHVGALYTELQLALRAVISGGAIDDLLDRRVELGARVRELTAPRVLAFGIELQDAEVKDLTLPGELKKIFTQVVKARQEGLAALEKARGETAALRNLANAAQMIERNPHLMQLRLLQVLGQQSGNTVVLGIGQTPAPNGPIPIRAAEPPRIEPEAPEG